MILRLVLKLLAYLPLSLLQAIGVFISRVAFFFSRRYSKMLHKNLEQSKVTQSVTDLEVLTKSNVAETGKAFLELPFIWFRPRDEVLSKIRNVSGRTCLEAIFEAKKGVIFITPHLGSFEVIPKYLSTYAPITCLYKPPHKTFFANTMLRGRSGHNQSVVPADLRGVRLLLKALKKGEAIGILPDQVPKAGDGTWENFFGRPAFTMTLVEQLVHRTESDVIFTYAVRIGKGDGFDLFFEQMTYPEQDFNSQLMNEKLEHIIRKNPSQYLWAYNRYKAPSTISEENRQRI